MICAPRDTILVTATAGSSEPLDVLVVEDDAAVAVEFVDCLTRVGLRAVHAPDAWQALDLIADACWVGVVVSDLRLPELDGLQFADHLNRMASDRRPEIIFVSGQAGFDDAVRAIRLEARDLLTKPVDPQTLVRAVRSALAVRELRAANAEPANRKATLQSLRAVRTVRSRYFPSELFSDPCWEMLLDLYDCVLTGQEVSVTSLAATSGVPATTAWRRISALQAHGLIERIEDRDDKRRSFVRLTKTGRAAVESFFETYSRSRQSA